jgi:transposase
MKAYSTDLRQRIVAARDARDGTRAQIAARFCVSDSFVRKLLRQRRDTGSIEPRPHGGGRQPAFDDEGSARLREAVRDDDDATLAELAEAAGVACSEAATCRALARLGISRKKLGRQSLIDERILKRPEVGRRVPAEASAQRPDGLTPLQAATKVSPGRQGGRDQVPHLDRPQSRRRRGHRPNRAAHHRPGAGHLPPAATPFVVAIRAEEPFQVVVGPRQVRHVVAPEQPGPVAASDLAEVVERLGQAAHRPAMPGQRGDQAAGAASHRRGIAPPLIGQDHGQPPGPAEGRPHLRPYLGRRLQALAQDRPQSG